MATIRPTLFQFYTYGIEIAHLVCMHWQSDHPHEVKEALDKELQSLLHEKFQHNEFKILQRDVCCAAMDGKEVSVFVPTGKPWAALHYQSSGCLWCMLQLTCKHEPLLRRSPIARL